MSTQPSLTIVPVADVPDDAILTCLNEAFGRHRTVEWFRWKHREGPWGPSTGWAALDDTGVVGVRLASPWRVVDVDGTPRAVARMTDGAVSPRARRQGVFSRLVVAETDSRTARGEWACLISTAVPASRAAYDKLGWTLPPKVQVATSVSSVTPTLRRPALTEVPVEALAESPRVGTGLATDWDAASLGWRFDQRSGHQYLAARLDSSDVGTAVVYRTTVSHRVPTLVEVLGRGPDSERDRLLRALAVQHRCLLSIRYVGAGTDRAARPVLSRVDDGPALAIWTTPNATAAAALDSWRFSAADLEGVI